MNFNLAMRKKIKYLMSLDKHTRKHQIELGRKKNLWLVYMQLYTQFH